MDIQRHNDRTGIFFLIALISLVFFIDIYIELDKVIKSGQSTRKHTTLATSMASSSNTQNFIGLPDRSSTKTNLHNTNNSVPVLHNLELSIIFFLLASFAFFYRIFIFDQKKQIISFLYFISFIRNEFTNTALPRPPPTQIV